MVSGALLYREITLAWTYFVGIGSVQTIPLCRARLPGFQTPARLANLKEYNGGQRLRQS